ncbi:MAG: hypothetical protein EXR71_11425 [Myxococcales bacterium]|nr:hypothetical protein [Myxococcales bacterium]
MPTKLQTAAIIGSAALTLALAAMLVPARWIPSVRREPPTAAPTEVIPDSIPEKRARSKSRKAWRAAMHLAGPDVDWERIERDNGRDRIARRNRLRSAPPPDGAPDDGDRWTERGSENQAGRTDVARYGADGSTLYVGAAAGGVWRREADGTWTPLGDGLFGGVHWLEIFPPEVVGDPDVLVAGTDGGYLHWSADDGQTWTEGAGLDWAWAQRRVAVSADGEQTLYSVRGNSDGYTAWRSEDRGAGWTKIADLGDFLGDLWVSRLADPTVWLATESGLVKSTDRGDTWETVGTWPAVDQVDLAASEAWAASAGAPRFWIVQNAHTLLRSDDGGVTFGSAVELDDYWGSLTASVIDPALVTYGGVEFHKSADAGATFGVQSGWAEYYDHVDTRLHADIMGIDVVPAGGGETWFVNTDGGTFRSDDALTSVSNQVRRGLRVSQYYDTLTSKLDATHMAAGAQDQGYQLSTGQGVTGHLYDFDQMLSGDYAHLVSGDGTHELVYSVYPGFLLVQVGEDQPALTYAGFPEDARAYGWLPTLVADPNDAERVYFGGDRLWAYDRESRWDWVPYLASEQDFQVDGDEYLSGVAFSPGDPDRAYAITSTGRFYRSDDHGVTWTLGERGLPAGQYWSGTAIVASALDVDTVYIGGSGYSNAAVWVSHDGGDHFEALNDGLPATLVYCLAEEPNSGVLFAGTETNAWRRDPGAEAWTDITGTEAPLVVYWSAEVVIDTGVVRFGTYGRGVWDYAYDLDLDGCVDGLDQDQDGTPCEEDCDDGSADIGPGMVDTCGDGLDQDCDGGDVTCPEDTGTDGVVKAPVQLGDGCQCGSGGPGAGLFALAVVLAGTWRRRQRMVTIAAGTPPRSARSPAASSTRSSRRS